MTSTGSKLGIVCCKPVPGGLVEAEIFVKGSRTVAELESLKRRVISLAGFRNDEYSASTTLNDVSGKPVHTITVVCFAEGMSHEAQIERLGAFMSALAPFVEVKGFDLSQLAAHSTLH